MNALRNKVQLIRSLGILKSNENLKVAKLGSNVSIATNESYKNQKGEKIPNLLAQTGDLGKNAES